MLNEMAHVTAESCIRAGPRACHPVPRHPARSRTHSGPTWVVLPPLLPSIAPEGDRHTIRADLLPPDATLRSSVAPEGDRHCAITWHQWLWAVSGTMNIRSTERSERRAAWPLASPPLPTETSQRGSWHAEGDKATGRWPVDSYFHCPTQRRPDQAGGLPPPRGASSACPKTVARTAEQGLLPPRLRSGRCPSCTGIVGIFHEPRRLILQP